MQDNTSHNAPLPNNTFPPVSIVTIVYNDLAHIKATMDSIISQDYPFIEYIIIDGASSDGTKEFILSYIQELAHITLRLEITPQSPESPLQSSLDCNMENFSLQDSPTQDSPLPPNLMNKSGLYIQATHKALPNFSFKFLSQSDSGIYDAMNKGIDLSTAPWCNFMNCGDRFYASNSIKALFEGFLLRHGGGDRIGVIYGDTHIIYDSTHSKILYAKATSHKYHHHFIHQSAFVSSLLLKTLHYDTSFKIAGDTDFFTKAYNTTNLGFAYIPLVVSSFTIAGVSSRLSWQMFKEDCIIGYKYNYLFPLYLSLKYGFYIIPRVCIRNLIPKPLRNKARISLSAKRS